MKYLSKEPMFFSMYRPSEKKPKSAPVPQDYPHKFVMGVLGMCQKCMLDREGHRKKYA